MASLMKTARSLFRRKPWPVLQFPITGFKVYGDDYIIEEQLQPHWEKGVYCPVDIGEVFESRYQVVGKLGFGVTSTVWLARDMQ